MLVLRAQLEERLRACANLMEAGVQVIDPATTYLDPGVEIGAGTLVFPNTTITGDTIVGRDCRIGPNTIIIDSRVGDSCEIFASVIEGSALEAEVDVGPFSHLRPDTYVESGVHIGNFVEVKASRLRAGSKVVADEAATAAGAVVTRDVAEGVQVGGVPAAPISQRKKNRKNRG
jgi:bifunctional UDP-N-acetylglucosamine pyrophosphorylase/glucosamine-1-phosphate N-acetyltransferase